MHRLAPAMFVVLVTAMLAAPPPPRVPGILSETGPHSSDVGSNNSWGRAIFFWEMIREVCGLSLNSVVGPTLYLYNRNLL